MRELHLKGHEDYRTERMSKALRSPLLHPSWSAWAAEFSAALLSALPGRRVARSITGETLGRKPTASSSTPSAPAGLQIRAPKLTWTIRWEKLAGTQSGTAGSTQKSASGRSHYPELDALRGAAAIVVLMNHFQQVWLATSHPHWIARPKLNPLLWLLVNGHASVILFFLLSGFVLTLPSLRGSHQPYPRYLIRRVCRIYPPYLAGLLISVIGCTFFLGRSQYGPEISGFWSARPDLRSILAHLAMVGRFNVYRYDGPVWSLVHEMRISIIFPLLLILSRRLKTWSTLATAAACTLLSSLSLRFLETGLPGSVRATAWSLTLSYCGTFLLGSALAQRREQYSRALGKAPLSTRLALLGAGLLLYLYPPSAMYGIDVSDFAISCGGLILLTFCLQHGSKTTEWLRTAPMQFLGRISYSVYLVHSPVLLVLAYTFYRHSPATFLLPFLALTILLATCIYYSVEVPSIKLGRKVGVAR